MRIPKSQSLGVVILVGIGIWCLLQALSNLPLALWPLLGDAGQIDSWTWASLGMVSIYAVVGGGLIFLRYSIAGLLFSGDEDYEVQGLSGPRLEELLVALLGLWFVVQALAEGISVEASLAMAFEENRSIFTLDAGRGAALNSGEAWKARLQYLPLLLMGLVLTVGAGSVSRLWRLVRVAGRRR